MQFINTFLCQVKLFFQHPNVLPNSLTAISVLSDLLPGDLPDTGLHG